MDKKNWLPKIKKFIINKFFNKPQKKIRIKIEQQNQLIL